ncbi:MAG: hypothetical protein AAGD35_12045 [Actinomycetota bacterium]
MKIRIDIEGTDDGGVVAQSATRNVAATDGEEAAADVVDAGEPTAELFAMFGAEPDDDGNGQGENGLSH